MLIKRQIENYIKKIVKKMPVISITGPRQSGKTTLVKKIFPNMEYVSLENPTIRLFAQNDPEAFFQKYNKQIIIDEIQRVPDLFSYIQCIVDKTNKPGQFIITGSSNFLMLKNITQSLAGRTSILKLLPFSLTELENSNLSKKSVEDYIYSGFYPRIYDKKLSPSEWYMSYIESYIEKDVRQIKNIPDLTSFQIFIRLCAGRIGKELNLVSLGNDCGISYNTAKAWLSILEASYITFRLNPYYQNFNKRLIKSPKLYFYDTGIVCSLLGIENTNQINFHFAKGELFENLILTELMKKYYNSGLRQQLYFWKSQSGHEIDCIIDKGEKPIAIEIKSGKTLNEDYFKNLKYWNKLSGSNPKNSYLIYGGNENQPRSHGNVISWKKITDFNPHKDTIS